jgi:hypothetical protein
MLYAGGINCSYILPTAIGWETGDTIYEWQQVYKTRKEVDSSTVSASYGVSFPDTTGYTANKTLATMSDLPTNPLTYSSTGSYSVAGATKTTYTYAQTTIYAPNGLIMGGTAAAAGLVTRGVCGVSTPTTGGACTKENLYVNYDSDNTYRSNRQLVLQAGSVGTHYGNNLYQYAAARGDAVKGWVEAQGYITSAPANFTTSVKTPSQCTSNGFYYVSSTTNSLSGADSNPFLQYHTSNSDFRILTTAYSDQWLQQIATDFRTPRIYYRRRDNGTWTNWVELVTTAVLGEQVTYNFGEGILVITSI